jgi:hypothetical protein
MAMRRFLLMLILIGLFGVSVVSAQSTTNNWKLTGAQSLADLTGEAYNPRGLPLLSPDGSAVVWAGDPDDGLHVYTFDDGQVASYPWPEGYKGFGRFSVPSWSPDANYLTFTESIFDYALESDLWMLDRAGGEITNRTDDGVEGGWFGQDKPMTLDYLPTWNPDNGDLYFLRSQGPANGDPTIGLYLLPVGRDEPKLVRDLTSELPTFSVYRPMAISPDGEQMAFIVLSNDLKDARNGLWTLDLKSGDVAQVATVDDFRTGRPSWQKETALYPDMLFWAGNDALVVLALDQQYTVGGVAQIAYYVSLADQAVTPLMDFQDVPDARSFFENDAPDGPIYRMPRSGVVSPDGSTFLFLRYGIDFNHAGISAIALPPDGSPPVEIGDDIDPFVISPAADARPVMSADGKALMSGYLFQFEPA